MNVQMSAEAQKLRRARKRQAMWGKLYRQRHLFLLVLPMIILVAVFNYGPMYGILISFKNYKAPLGITGSPWAKPFYKYFETFFRNPASGRLLVNTLKFGATSMLFGFPMPIIFALLLNEISHSGYKRTVQTISYMPHFLSTIVVVGFLTQFSAIDGQFNDIRALFGLPRESLLHGSRHFIPLYVFSGVWQSLGWSSIIYLSALAGVDPTLYDVANIDGANRWQKVVNISLPTIAPTIVVLLILSIRGILGTDFEKILLMQNDSNKMSVDVISTYVYREGIEGGRYEYTTAIGLFMSAISFVIVFVTNGITRMVSPENSLW